MASTSTSAQERYYDLLMDKVRDDQYPSGELLDRIEAAIVSRQQAEDYLELLIERVDSTRYPSHQLLDRIERLSRRLS